MLSKKIIIGSLASLGLLFGVATNRTVAQITHETHNSVTSETNEFQRIEQPLWVKGAVTASGLGFIALDIWWFLLTKPQSKKAEKAESYRQKMTTIQKGK